jgi:hypothetical protein
VVYICIGKQKVVWIPKLRENGWEAAASALTGPLNNVLVISPD